MKISTAFGAETVCADLRGKTLIGNSFFAHVCNLQFQGVSKVQQVGEDRTMAILGKAFLEIDVFIGEIRN